MQIADDFSFRLVQTIKKDNFAHLAQTWHSVFVMFGQNHSLELSSPEVIFACQT